MTDENTIIETTEEVKEINNGDLKMEPLELDDIPIYSDELYSDFQPLDDKTIITDTEDIEIYGSFVQRKEMFTDWASYIGEIQNPNTTAVNPFFKKPDGTGSLYAPLDEVLNCTRPILSKYGFGIIQVPSVKMGQVSIKTIISHKSGGFMNFPKFTLPITKNDAQGIIAGTTYARRGGLNPILGVHGEVDDDGNEATGAKPQDGNKKPVVEKDELSEVKDNLVKIVKELGGSKNAATMEIVTKVEPSGNVNRIENKTIADKLYLDLQTMRENIKVNKENK